MGCWNETCALSHLPIRAGDEVVFLVLTRTPYFDHEARTGCYIGDHWFPRTLPLFAKYNDYGSIEDWTPTEVPLIESIVEGFRRDLFETRETRRDSVLRIPSRQKANLNWDNVLNWLQEGHVRIDRYAYEGRKRITPAIVRKALRENEEFIAKYGEEFEKIPKNASAKRKAEIEKRNQKRGLLDSAAERYARELEQPSVLPCLKILIRKDVWDSLLQMGVNFWNSSIDYSKIQEDAKAWKTAARKIRTQPDELLDILRKSKKGVSKKELKDLEESVAFLTGHRISQEVGSDCIFEFSGLRGNGTPPFQMGPHDALKAALTDFLRVDSPAVEEKVDLFMERFGQLRYIEYVMSLVRLAWNPTSGSGSQNDEKVNHFEFHARCAKIACDLALEEGQESFESLMKTPLEDEWDKKALARALAERETYAEWGKKLSSLKETQT